MISKREWLRLIDCLPLTSGMTSSRDLDDSFADHIAARSDAESRCRGCFHESVLALRSTGRRADGDVAVEVGAGAHVRVGLLYRSARRDHGHPDEAADDQHFL